MPERIIKEKGPGTDWGRLKVGLTKLAPSGESMESRPTSVRPPPAVTVHCTRVILQYYCTLGALRCAVVLVEWSLKEAETRLLAGHCMYSEAIAVASVSI